MGKCEGHRGLETEVCSGVSTTVWESFVWGSWLFPKVQELSACSSTHRVSKQVSSQHVMVRLAGLNTAWGSSRRPITARRSHRVFFFFFWITKTRATVGAKCCFLFEVFMISRGVPSTLTCIKKDPRETTEEGCQHSRISKGSEVYFNMDGGQRLTWKRAEVPGLLL